MTEKRASEVSRFTLPFWAISESRKEPFTQDMAKAVVFSLAELERAKGGGIILKQPTEKLVFIAKSHYPFWLVPWGEQNLLFDGLSTSAHTLAYKPIPDAKTFIRSVERSSKALEAYTAFLSDNTSYFREPTTSKQAVSRGLISDQNLLSEFTAYLADARQTEAPPSDVAVMPPTLDEPEYTSVIGELENLKSAFNEEKDALYECMKSLNRVTRNFTKAIRDRMKKEKDEFDKQIEEQKATVKPEVDRINEECDEKIAKLTKDFDKQLLPLQKEKVKSEKSREQALGKIERYKMEAKTAAANKNAVSERKWKEKTDETKKELSEIEARMKEFDTRIRGVEDSRTVETFKLRSECEAKLREAQKELLELEAGRDARMQFHKSEIEKLEKPTTSTIEQISALAKMREGDLARFERLGFKQKYRANTLVHVPFYLVCYQSGSRKRYAAFVPSVVNSIGLFTKLKGALGRARIKQLLVPRFKAIAAHLYRFPSVIERNPVLEREMNEACERVSLLNAGAPREQIGKGLKQLKEEGWLSEKEYDAFAEALT